VTGALKACSARRIAADVPTRDKHFHAIENTHVIQSLET